MEDNIILTKDYIYEITWHIESALNSNKRFPKDTTYFSYTGSALICKTEEELTQGHIPWYMLLKFSDIYSFTKGMYADGREYISIPNPLDYSKSTKIVFDKVVPYASKQIIEALSN